MEPQERVEAHPTLVKMSEEETGGGSLRIPRFLAQQMFRGSGVISARLALAALARLARDESESSVSLIADAAGLSPSGVVRARALDILATLARGGNSTAQEAVCELFLQFGDPRAAELALVDGYGLVDAGRRAIFLFLTECWDELKCVAPGGIVPAQRPEPPIPLLDERIAATALAAKRLDWAFALARDVRREPLPDSSSSPPVQGEWTYSMAQWDAAAALFADAGEWDLMWRILPRVNAQVARSIVLRLTQAGWAPSGARDRTLLQSLARLADRLDGALPEDPEQSSVETGHEGFIRTVTFDSIQSQIVTSGDDGTIRLCRAPDGTLTAVLAGHEGAVRHVAVLPPGQLLISAGHDGTVRLWDLKDGYQVCMIQAHKGQITALACSGDGRIAATAGVDGYVCAWKMPGGELIQRIGASGLSRGVCACLAIAPDTGSLVGCITDEPPLVIDGRAVLSEPRALCVWRLGGGEMLERIELRPPGFFDCPVFHPSGRYLFTGGDDVRLWRMSGGILLRTLQGHSVEARRRFAYDILDQRLPPDFVYYGARQLLLSPDGSRLCTAARSGTIRLWGLPGASEAFWTRNTGVAYGVAADDGVRVLASTGDGIAYVWRPPDPSPAREFSVDGLRLCLSPDGHTLAVADTDGRIWIWNWGARRILETAIGKLAPADLSLAEERCGALEHGCQERLWLEFVLAARRTTGH